MVNRLKQRLDPNARVRARYKLSRGRWRYTVYDAGSGGFVLSGPIRGFATAEEAIEHAHRYLHVEGE